MIIDSNLQFFDGNDNFLASMNYVLDLETSLTLKEEQDRKRAEDDLKR